MELDPIPEDDPNPPIYDQDPPPPDQQPQQQIQEAAGGADEIQEETQDAVQELIRKGKRVVVDDNPTRQIPIGQPTNKPSSTSQQQQEADFLKVPYPFNLPNDLHKRQPDLVYRPIERIGIAFHGAVNVYKVFQMRHYPETGDKRPMPSALYTLKLITKDVQDQSEAAYQDLLQRVQRSSLIPKAPNLIAVTQAFTCANQGCFCVLFPNMELGSVRNILRAKFPNGMPVNYVACILKYVLKALEVIHEKDQVHGEINTGHIYTEYRPVKRMTIKLGFAATVYHHRVFKEPASTSTQQPITSIFEWAAAPEIYNSEGGGNAPYTKEADIWMIGVTALEMAYGRFETREVLENVLERIRRQKRLPRRSEGEQGQGAGTPKWMKAVFPGKKKEKRAFSKRFENVVMKCLRENPAERPTVKKLFKDKMFKKAAASKYLEKFRDVAISDF